MTTRRKLMSAGFGIVALALVATFVSSSPRLGGRRYFKDGRCACGYDSYIFLQGTNYFTYTPGHGYPPRRALSLRKHHDEWEMLAVGQTSNAMYTTFGPAEGTVVGLLRFEEDHLLEQLTGNTNWTCHARVYNPVPIWLAKLRAEPPPKINCVNNLKQIGLAFRQWALDHGDKYPFNVPVDAGGTRDLCLVTKDGFDSNAALHFQVMSNELNTPLLLVCPKDHSRKAASNFTSLQALNVTYHLRSGTNLADTNPTEVLAVCPIDGNTLYCDGSVKKGKK